MRVIDDAGSTGLKRFPAECYAPPVDFVADVTRSLKEASAVEAVLPDWRPPSKEQQRLEARAAASSQRLACDTQATRGRSSSPPKPKAKKVWRAEVLLDKMIAAENRYYRAQLDALNKRIAAALDVNRAEMLVAGGYRERTCCPHRARVLTGAESEPDRIWSERVQLWRERDRIWKFRRG